MGLQKLKDYHKEMALDEALFRVPRSKMLEKYSDYVSSMEAIHRIMNDPLVMEYKEALIRRRDDQALEKVLEAEAIILKNLVDSANTVSEIMKDKDNDAKTRLAAARDNLNRGNIRIQEDMDKKATPRLIIHDSKKEAKKDAV